MPNDELLNSWIRLYKENGYARVEKAKGTPSTMNKKDQFHKTYEDMAPKEKINYLENKNQYLEAENEALKKLIALVLQRNKQQ